MIKTPNGWSHFRWQVYGFDTYWVIHPFSKELSPKINELQAITFYRECASDVLKFVAPPKPYFLKTKNRPWKVLQKKIPKNIWASKKWKIANHLKLVLPKFLADPSFVQGVNGRWKFRQNFETRELAFEKVTSAIRTGLVGSYVMLRRLNSSEEAAPLSWFLESVS